MKFIATHLGTSKLVRCNPKIKIIRLGSLKQSKCVAVHFSILVLLRMQYSTRSVIWARNLSSCRRGIRFGNPHTCRTRATSQSPSKLIRYLPCGMDFEIFVASIPILGMVPSHSGIGHVESDFHIWGQACKTGIGNFSTPKHWLRFLLVNRNSKSCPLKF